MTCYYAALLPRHNNHQHQAAHNMANEVDALEARTIAKLMARFVPLLVLSYFVAYLDRVNVGFAALSMQSDLGLSATTYGFGAGIFFLGYFLFEVPSNLLLARFGARKWIARIMLTWGLISGAMALVDGETSFIVMRFLLGIAEAGFFPGIIYFLTLWFPAGYRARIVGCVIVAVPLSSVIGAPVSSLLLGLDGWLGLKGWQLLFIIEALPALLMSAVVYCKLTDRPADAHWLDADERAWLAHRLELERRQREAQHGQGLLRALLNRRLLALCAVYFGVNATIYGLAFFLPQIVQAFGVSTLRLGFIAAVPYAVGAISLVLWGRRSDRKLERRFHLAFPLSMAAAGIAAAALLDQPTLKMIAFSVAGFGMFGAAAVFWTLPTARLSGVAAAAGIAMINSLGTLAGFAGPYAMGWIKDATGSYTGGLLSLAAAGLVAAIIVLSIGQDPPAERAADP
jgi:MFS transporter, ACS family, tartrate transporter